MMQNSSACRHPRSRDYYRRTPGQIEGLGALSSMNKTEMPRRKRIYVALVEPLHIRVMVFLVLQVQAGCRSSHWRINRDRQDGYAPLLFQLTQVIDEQLSAADGKSRNYYLSTPARGRIDDLR